MAEMSQHDLIIRNATVLADPVGMPASNCDIVIDDGRFTAVGSHTGRGRSARLEIDGSDLVVTPGLCNAHSHAFQRALAGRTEERSPAGRDNFWTWRKRMYELAGKMRPEILSAVARQAYNEMLTSGYTTVAEFH